ncbi:MAG: ErfK/YbiS/YcfS/YnhG family protein [Firmicutes bacterium]|nr:ErfK/YbiS/YcfS/YnhG family protein [Bacillota bacterium]
MANPGGAFGAMWMGLNIPHYGIHGTNSPSSIGKIVSHGCIRMYNNDVLVLSRLVSIGTPVRIHY